MPSPAKPNAKKRGRPPKHPLKSLTSSEKETPSPAASGKKRGRPPKKSPHEEKVKNVNATTLPTVDKQGTKLPKVDKEVNTNFPARKLPLIGGPKAGVVSTTGAAFPSFKLGLPPPPPPPPPVNNPYYEKFVRDYWEKFYANDTFLQPRIPLVAAAKLDSKPQAKMDDREVNETVL